jgi:hypothetical protein
MFTAIQLFDSTVFGVMAAGLYALQFRELSRRLCF